MAKRRNKSRTVTRRRTKTRLKSGAKKVCRCKTVRRK